MVMLHIHYISRFIGLHFSYDYDVDDNDTVPSVKVEDI